VTVPGARRCPRLIGTPASGLAAAEACPVDAWPVAAALLSACAPPWGSVGATMPVRTHSPGRSRSAPSGMPPLGGSMDVRHASTIPLIRMTPLLNDLMSVQHKAMEGSSGCDRR
jgi:hypothetical protein